MEKLMVGRAHRMTRSICLTRTRLSCLLLAVCMAGLPARGQSSTSFDKLSREAQAAKDRGDAAAGIQLYEKALAQKPGWQEGWWYDGSLLYDQNQYARAAAALRHLVALNPKLGGAWALLGLSEFEVGKTDNALSDLQKAKALGTGTEPSLTDVVDYHLAILLNAHGEPDAAS